MSRRVGWICILFVFSTVRGYAQHTFTFTFHECPVREVMERIERETGHVFSYSPAVLEGVVRERISAKRASLEQVLNLMFKPRGISWEMFEGYIILKKKRRFFRVYGRIVDEESRERLIGASVYDARSRIGTASNNYGFYTIVVPGGEVELRCSYVGYRGVARTLRVNSDTVVDISLRPVLDLEEVVVARSAAPGWARNVQPGQLEFPVVTANAIPKLLGESDLLKTIELFPGVRSGAEGIAGLLVRGGNRDENQFLIDDIPLYNAHHLLGFFSSFNADAVKNVNFYKSGFPARYGGHLSSVMDVRLKEGNTREYHGSFSVGLLSSKFSLEGPIEKQRSSFMITGRRTYMDLIAAPIYAAVKNTRDSKEKVGYNFSDVNVKLTRAFGNQDALSVIFFWCDDRLKYKTNESEGNYASADRSRDYVRSTWGNWGIGVRWDKMVSPGLYANTLISYNRYQARMNKRYRRESPGGDTVLFKKIYFESGQEEWRVKSDFTYALNEWNRVHFGGHYIYHVFCPEKRVTLRCEGEVEPPFVKRVNNKEYAHEMTIYAEDEIAIKEKWSLYPGVRVVWYRVGNTNYFSGEPRFSVQYKWRDDWAAKASYTLMSQYIHQLGSSTLNMPTDLWVPVSDVVRPMKSHQVVAGVYYHPGGPWCFSLEGFYKTQRNLIDDYNGLDITPEYMGWKENVHLGRGLSRGLEWMLQKKGGRTNGWINYTLSQATRWFPGGATCEEERFPARYDSRHMVNVVLLHTFSDFFDVSATWTYNNGFYTTQPLERYDSPVNMPGEEGKGRGDIVFHVGERNNVKTLDYHRLDLGFNFHRRRRHGTSTWSINLYNAYCRLNTIGLSPDYDTKYKDQEERQFFDNDWLFPIIPSFSYTFTF